MRKICVLCVCGSGTVTSSMLAAKIEEKLETLGVDAECIETNPAGVESALGSHDVAFMACSRLWYSETDGNFILDRSG